MSRGTFFVVALLCSSCLGGAGLKVTSSGGGSFHVGRTSGEFCTENGRVILVVWADDASGVSAGGGNGRWHGEFRTHDGRTVPWNCTTADGRAGRITIAGTDFDLAKGTMFLVTTRGVAPHVQQLTIDVNVASPTAKGDEFEATRQRLAELADSDKTVKGFVESAARIGKKAE